jgi:hypothetical protein
VGKHRGGGATGMAEDSPTTRLLRRRKGAAGVDGDQGGLHGSGRGQGGLFVAQTGWTVNRGGPRRSLPKMGMAAVI